MSAVMQEKARTVADDAAVNHTGWAGWSDGQIYVGYQVLSWRDIS